MRQKNKEQKQHGKPNLNAETADLNRNALDVLEIIKSYARQELIDPLKVVPRWLILGLIGSVVITGGVILLMLALLRYLQSDTGSVFAGNWSWSPYAITVAAVAILIAVMWALINKRSLS